MQTAGNNSASGDDASGFSQPLAWPHDAGYTFDGETINRADLTFGYARQAFATMNLPWPLDDNHQDDNHQDDSARKEATRNNDNDERLASLLRRDAMFTNLALFISDQCPSTIKCATFDGDTKASISEKAELRGSLLRQLNMAMSFLNSHNRHDEGRQWPQPALREALVNAVLHRDYRYSGPTLVNVFASRIEVVSLGGLMPGLEINDLLNGICQARNPALADLFAALGFSENYGTGIRRIMDEYENYADSPQIRVGTSSVALVLPLPTPLTPKRRTTAHGKTGEGDTVKSSDRPSSGHAKMYAFPAIMSSTTSDPAVALAGMRVIGCLPVMGGVPDSSFPAVASLRRLQGDPMPAPGDGADTQAPPVPPHSTQTLEEVTLHCIAQSGTPLTRRQIAEDLGKTKNQMTYVLRHLVERGLVLRQGQSRATRYSLP